MDQYSSYSRGHRSLLIHESYIVIFRVLATTLNWPPCFKPADAQTTCKRCLVHNLTCEYKKHQRGRTKKVPVSNSDIIAIQDLPLPDQPILPPPPQKPLPPPSLGSGIGDTVDSGNDRGPSSQTLQLGGGAPHRVEIQFSHVIPIEGDSSRKSEVSSASVLVIMLYRTNNF